MNELPGTGNGMIEMNKGIEDEVYEPEYLTGKNTSSSIPLFISIIPFPVPGNSFILFHLLHHVFFEFYCVEVGVGSHQTHSQYI